ncbi:MAG: hypothetical protein RJA07_2813 [Bacteroidota bacterium]
MKKIISLISLCLLFLTIKANPLSGIYAIPGSYPAGFATIKMAVDSLNANGINGAVTFNIGAGIAYTETLTGALNLGNTFLNAQTSATNTITFQKDVTATANPLLIGFAGVGNYDGMWNLNGIDYVIIDGIDLQDAVSNLTTTTQMEWGFGLFKLNSTAPYDGCQNNTISNCVIALSSTNPKSTGIAMENKLKTGIGVFYNSSATAADCNSNNHIYSNTIQNVAVGIEMIGYSGVGMALNLYDTGNDVGGSTSVQGNRIVNFGGGYSASGIKAGEQLNLNISNNTIDNYNAGLNGAVATTASLYGFYNYCTANSFVNQNSTINNNSILLTTIAGFSNTLACVYSTGCEGKRTISSNTIKIANLSGTAGSGTYYGVYDFTNVAGATIGQDWTITNNTLNNITINNNTGTFYGFYLYGHGGYVNTFSGNQMTNFQRTNGTTGYLYPLYSFNDVNYKTAGTSANWFNNTFSNINNGASNGDIYLYWAPGGGKGGTTAIYNNIISNINGASFRNYMPYFNYKSSITVHDNTINHITTGALAKSIIGLGCYFQDSTNSNTYQNTISDLVASDSSTALQAVVTESTAGINNFYKNTISNLSNTSTKFSSASNIYGLSASLGLSVTGANGIFNCYNNLIGNFTTSNNNNSGWGIVGIEFSALSSDSIKTKVANFYNNTIYITGTSSQAYFGAIGIYLNDTKNDTILLRNNVIVNLATNTNANPSTFSWQTSAACIGKQNSNRPTLNSNHNVLYAGTPSAYNLIYRDASNAYQTLSAYQAGTNQDAASFTENPNFISITPSTNGYLHINRAFATKCESGGISFNNLTDDVDGDIRFGNTGYVGTGSAPDIGADEFNGSSTCSYTYHSIVDTICSSITFHGQTLTASGVYYDTLLNVGGCDSIVTLFLTIDSSYCVWPGDANSDLVADNLDIFPIGLLNGTTGPVRNNASLIWIDQPATTFGTTASGFTVDAKHADCNGDGIIDGNDTTAILQNYGLTHLRKKSGADLLSVTVGPDTLYQNTIANIAINLGTAALPLDSIYGVAFSFNVDPTAIDTNSISIATNASWLFNNPSDHFHIYKLTKSATRVDVGLVRNDHVSKSGFGTIVNIAIDIITGNIVGRENGMVNKKYQLHCSVDNATILKLDGSMISANMAQDSSLILYTRPDGISNVSTQNLSQSIIPNPATNNVSIKLRGYNYNEEKKLILIDATGRLMLQKTFTSNQTTIDISELNQGIYIAKIISEKGITESKLIKQ